MGVLLVEDERSLTLPLASLSFRRGSACWSNLHRIIVLQRVDLGKRRCCLGGSEQEAICACLGADRRSNRCTQMKIWALQLDLRHENEVRSFCEELKSRALTLGVIDTSDVPNASETGASVAAQYVKLISRYAPDNAVFLNTAPSGGHRVLELLRLQQQKKSRPGPKHDQAMVRDRNEED